MVEEERDNSNLIRISSRDEQQQQQRHPRALLEASLSTISIDNSNVPRSVIDVFDEIYSNRIHRKCINRSYLTLLSMTLAVIFWMSYWLADNNCQSSKDTKLNSFLCDLVIILEVLTFILICISPFLFILMIYSWIYYSCYNPMDLIKENCKGFKIEGNQWKQQLDYYYKKKKIRYLNCFRCKQRKELNDRGYGYIILSSHGIVIDELILLSARKDIIDNGILLNNNKLLKLTFKRTWIRPWKISISIYLPEDLIYRRDMEELQKLLKIQTNIDIVSSSSV